MRQKQGESVPASKRKNHGRTVSPGPKKQRTSISNQDLRNQRRKTIMTQTPFDPSGSFSSKEFSSSSSSCFFSTPKEHVEEIRRTKFSIGGEPNPLIEDLHQAVKNLSAELYAKDVHFLMELIQNAEDNQYDEGVDPSLEFIITSRDITATGAPATLLIFNNEKGFSPRNIESICSVGRSTKKGNRSRGYIGEKGIGFKSVFLITAQPCIFSNGYQIRLNEEPCPHCGLGYIVPEWVDDNPTLVDLKQIYRAGDALPTTIIVLPLKPDKVQPVKKQLSCIHAEVLLFLSKIKQLSVREDNEDPNLNTISTVVISSEIDFQARENINAESYMLHLSSEENDDSAKECSYFMWKQKFPVRPDNRVERRMDVDEWVITLAFPNQERLNRGTTLPGVYAFLPTEMVTNFPFIIQADFVLASSRETVLLDNKWNQGILDCVPSAFMDALKALVITGDGAPISCVPRMFEFLPVNSSSYPALNDVRDKIKVKVAEEKIVPIESYNDQKRFYKPCEVGRLKPAFWDILKKAQHHGVSLRNLSSHGKYILNSSFDRVKYDPILKFLGVRPVNNEWYAKCIQSSNLVQGVPEDAYLELLLFVANGWMSSFQGSNMTKIPLIKCVASNGGVCYFSVNDCARFNSVSLAGRNQFVSWLIDWNQEFKSAFTCYFLPKSTQQAIGVFHQRHTLSEWLQNHAKVSTMNVYNFANRICNSIRNDGQLAIVYAHFLHHSFSKGYISKSEVENLCRSMPLLDSYGNVAGYRVGVLVPADVSKWVELMVSNPWRSAGYVELGKEYLLPGHYAGQSTPKHGLLDFLKSYVGASDIPHISPPNAWFSAVDTPLSKKNAFLLLEWIHNLKWKGIQMPTTFFECIKEGSWLRVHGNGCRPPSQSFLIDSRLSLGKILQSGSALVDIALVDQNFYGDKINEYKEELKTVGVMFSFEEACQFIGGELMSRAASSYLSRGLVLLILKFMQYLRNSLLPLDQFVDSIKKGSWLRMSGGNYRSPVGSILYDSGWQTAKQISDIPIIDQEYYGEDIYQFKEELKLLGVIVGFDQSYQVVIDHLKSTSHLKSLTAEAVVLILECLHFSTNSATLVDTLRETKWLKTKKMGFKEPRECYLYDPEWGCILEVFNDFPVIDHDFYGAKLFSYKSELNQAGVVVDFEDAIRAFARVFEQKAKQSSFNKQHVVSFLLCCRLLKKNGYRFPMEFIKILREAKWLRTRLYNDGFRSPGGCILFGPEWECISPITHLPFIDDSDNFYGEGIHEFKEELKSIGVVTELKDGVKFIPTCLRFPSDPSIITPGNVLSLLECIRLILPGIRTLEDSFIKRLSENWLKTHAGYRSPDQCLLFDSKWSLYLKPTDGPFIDENFYGPIVASYKNELRAMGVTVDVEKGCSLIASHLPLLSEFSTIAQTDRYLSDYNWKPQNEAEKRIWIPSGKKNGEWVNPDSCIIHDNDHLFCSKFYILEKYYDKKLLPFFSNAMDVRQKPSVDDYIELWKKWECSAEQLSNSECCKFWVFISKHWNLKTQKMLAESLMKLPAGSGSEGILLIDKQNVFVADNLHLRNLFEQERVFVWYPQPSLAELPMSKLLDIYRQIGVRTISQSVEKVESSLPVGVVHMQVDPKNYFIGKVLVKLILGFLACSSLKMEVEKRLGAVQGLLDLTVHETREPATVNYSLSLSPGAVVTKKENRMVRWERESSKFFTQKIDWCSGSASMIKYATYFSEAISVGVLRENLDHIRALSELIKWAFVMKFEEEPVKFLMEDNNLQIFLEDEEFLSSAFPSD